MGSERRETVASNPLERIQITKFISSELLAAIFTSARAELQCQLTAGRATKTKSKHTVLYHHCASQKLIQAAECGGQIVIESPLGATGHRAPTECQTNCSSIIIERCSSETSYSRISISPNDFTIARKSSGDISPQRP